MKLYLDNIIFSLQRSGGISVVWKNIIETLQQSNCEHFTCLEYNHAESNIFRKEMNLGCVRSNRLPIQIARYLNPKIAFDDPFLFHSSYYRVCSNRNSRNITTVHDFTYEYFSRGLSKAVHCWQKYKAIRKSDVVVCISEHTKRDLLRFLPDIDESKVIVIHNGVSEDYRVVKSNRFSDLGDFVLFVGARQSYKNFSLVVEAIQTTTLKLIIVGKPLTQSESIFIDNSLGRDRYRVYPFCSNEELNELYNAAYCFAYPSLYEGFGIPVLEAQRAGCPVIAFNSSSIPEVIGDTPLLLHSASTKEFVEKLELLKLNSVRNEIVEQGLANSSRFSWERMGRQYFELYKQLGLS